MQRQDIRDENTGGERSVRGIATREKLKSTKSVDVEVCKLSNK